MLLGVLCSNHAYARDYSQAKIQKILIEYAQHHSNVPPALALALAHIESHFQSSVVSHKGAIGVMQIMPATAHGEFHVNKNQLYNPYTNIAIGIEFLEKLYHAYGRWDLALSHYNGGSLKKVNGYYIAHDYTKKYVHNVMKKWRYYERKLAQRNLIKAKNNISASIIADDKSGHLANIAIDHARLYQHHDWQKSLKIAENWLKKKNLNKITQKTSSMIKKPIIKTTDKRFTW